VQASYLDVLLPAWREGDCRLRGRRELILKFRQPGFSTLIFALLFLDTLTTPHTHTVAVAHDADSTERLFQIVRRMYENLPEEQRPATRYANRREFLWPALDSSFFVGTAGTRDFGRSATINNAHLSEAASYPDAAALVAGLLQAVPADGNVFVETTAKGMGNWFHDEWTAAEKGDSVFTPRFFGWNAHGVYRAPEVPADFRPTADERVLVQRHGLDAGQLLWRREKVKELRQFFVQEYPLTASEAFLATGGRVLSEFIPERAPAGHLVEDFVPPRSWRHFLVIDPGWRVCAGLWGAVDPEGQLWLYGEHYEGEKLPREHVAALHGQWQLYGQPPVEVLMDPAGFDIKRTTTGREAPSDADEFKQAAQELKATWLRPKPADNGDPQAYRVKRRLAENTLFVCEGLRHWRWEQERWVRQAPRSGRLAAEHPEPDRPIDRFNHLQDTLRYLVNHLDRPQAAGGFSLVGKARPS